MHEMEREYSVAGRRRARGHRRRRWRRWTIRLLALLIAIVAIAGIIGTFSFYERIDRLEATSQGQLQQVSTTIRQGATSLRTVGMTTGNAAASIGTARTSLNDTAQVTRSIGANFEQLALITTTPIPGLTVQPLESLSLGFRQQAAQFRELANQVDETNRALARNDGDLRAIDDDANRLADRLDDTAQQIQRYAGGSDAGSPAGIAKSARLALGWSMLIHLLLLFVALALALLTFDDPA